MYMILSTSQLGARGSVLNQKLLRIFKRQNLVSIFICLHLSSITSCQLSFFYFSFSFYFLINVFFLLSYFFLLFTFYTILASFPNSLFLFILFLFLHWYSICMPTNHSLIARLCIYIYSPLGYKKLYYIYSCFAIIIFCLILLLTSFPYLFQTKTPGLCVDLCAKLLVKFTRYSIIKPRF